MKKEDSCEYCVEDQKIFKTELISHSTWAWGWADRGVFYEDAEYFQQGVFIDRGFLRLVDLEDYQCMESGEKIKINFCPFCGNKVIGV